MTTYETAMTVVKTLNSKKAEGIEAIEIGQISILADYFVIASASNTAHVKALADEVEYQLKQQGKLPARIEGYSTANWIVLDYLDVVVHIFYQEAREFYNLSKLWSDGKKLDLTEYLD